MAAPNIDWVENSLCHCARQAARNQLVDHLWYDLSWGHGRSHTAGHTTGSVGRVGGLVLLCGQVGGFAHGCECDVRRHGVRTYGGAAPVGSGLGWRDGGTVESWATEVAGWDQRVKLACWRVGMLACWRVGATEVMVLSLAISLCTIKCCCALEATCGKCEMTNNCVLTPMFFKS